MPEMPRDQWWRMYSMHAMEAGKVKATRLQSNLD